MDREAGRQRATLWQVMAGILASFFGVRGRRKHEEGMAKATPGQVIIVALLLTALFVSVLFIAVRMVIALATG